MRDEIKYLFMCIVSVVLTIFMGLIQFVDPKPWSLITLIISIIAVIGSVILYIQERKENSYINKSRKKKKSGKRFK